MDFGPLGELRICVTGGRDWTDERFVWRSLNEFERVYGEIIELGHGNARGVDKMARRWCERAGVPDRPYDADWERHGDAAGPIRNIEMLMDFRPQYLLVFPGGVGTTHCAREARKISEKKANGLVIERVFYSPETDPVTDLLAWG